jgi:hypothetical protein
LFLNKYLAPYLSRLLPVHRSPAQFLPIHRPVDGLLQFLEHVHLPLLLPLEITQAGALLPRTFTGFVWRLSGGDLPRWMR